ncbi:hypothetical protein AWW66_17110 [Micromonospora rosaria]|uniref:Uncharacterized protein n=1 Tax=Micromonospora rosaria TaxID=47874 RepID=A0A136PQQ8_9ACTN|nr:hypothetical protein [Micromonospora rosaria]KXK60782.1 hypothetical protein AWW66_17110 [Micromonospora rosaria]
MAVDRGDPLGTFLVEASRRPGQIAVASLVERMAQLFTGPVGATGGRTADVEAFLLVLDDLWRPGPADDEPWRGNAARLMALPELAAEREPSGALAFACHALAVAYYACEYRRTGEVRHATRAGSHALDSMFFLTEHVGDGVDRMAQERALRRRDVEELSAEADLGAVSGQLRDRSRRRSAKLVAALLVPGQETPGGPGR